MGYDSDEPIAHGEVGKVGVAIDSIDDMRVLFDGLPLDEISTSMTINAPGSMLLLLYQLVAEEQGVAGDKLTGTIQNDVLKEYIARGTYIYPPGVAAPHRRHLRLLPQGAAALEHDLHLRLPHGEAGATPVQEVAFTLANAMAYVRAARPRGSTSTTSRRACPSSSSLARRSSRRSRSSEPRGGSGRGSCRSGSARRTPSR